MACEIIRPPAGTTTIAGTIDTENLSPIGSGKISVIAVTNTAWTALPAGPLANRQGLGIQNISGGTILVNWSNTAPANEGILLAAGAERYYSVKASAIVYIRLQTLASGNVTIEELAR